MFQFPGLATCNYEFIACQFEHLGIITCLSAPPSFSQTSTLFIASQCRGIPRAPLVT